MDRIKVLENLRSMIDINGHIVSVASGCGMTVKHAIEGGADLLLALNAGKLRYMGQSSFASFFSYKNCNQQVLDLAIEEILPNSRTAPVLCGIYMQDPTISLFDYINKLHAYGFSGVINYPSVGFFDGSFRLALEEEGLGYEKEVEGIRYAHFLDLFTIAYVFNEEQARAMLEAGADAICIHFGITGGGILGAEHVLPIEMAVRRAKDIFEVIDKINPSVIKLICGGPVETPEDTVLFFRHTSCQGVILGSAVERIPVETTMNLVVKEFKYPKDDAASVTLTEIFDSDNQKTDYAQFMLRYIENNYQKPIRISDISNVVNISTSRLNTLFREKTGIPFRQYLIDYRMEQAKRLLSESGEQIKNISMQCGYEDYYQFVKMFRKKYQMTPSQYREQRKVYHNESNAD